MDGVHRDALLHMPKHLKLQLIQLINRVEQTGLWPDPLLHGGVFSLGKRPGANQVHEFRPITILPIGFRPPFAVVSSLHTFRVLHQRAFLVT